MRPFTLPTFVSFTITLDEPEPADMGLNTEKIREYQTITEPQTAELILNNCLKTEINFLFQQLKTVFRYYSMICFSVSVK